MDFADEGKALDFFSGTCPLLLVCHARAGSGGS